MLLRSFLASSALALTAKAFLIPIEVANEVIKAKNSVNEPPILVKVDCPGCPFAVASEDINGPVWVDGIPNVLEMAFSTENNQLLMNKVPMLGPDMGNVIQPLRVHQLSLLPEMNQSPFEGEFGLSYSLELKGQEAPKNDAGILGYHNVNMQILGLADQMVNPNTVEISLMKKADGELIIQRIHVFPTALSPTASQCTNMLCRAMDTIVQKMNAAGLNALKAAQNVKNGCMRKFGLAPPASFHPKIVAPVPAIPPPGRSFHLHGGPAKFTGKFHPSLVDGGKNEHKIGHGHHHMKHHHSALNVILHAVKSVLKHVILPVLIGIAAGMAASAVGMLVGHVLVFFWIKYRRGGRQGYASVAQVEGFADEPAEEDDEVRSLPPKYEELAGSEVPPVVDEKKGLN